MADIRGTDALLLILAKTSDSIIHYFLLQMLRSLEIGGPPFNYIIYHTYSGSFNVKAKDIFFERVLVTRRVSQWVDHAAYPFQIIHK